MQTITLDPVNRNRVITCQNGEIRRWFDRVLRQNGRLEISRKWSVLSFTLFNGTANAVEGVILLRNARIFNSDILAFDIITIDHHVSIHIFPFLSIPSTAWRVSRKWTLPFRISIKQQTRTTRSQHNKRMIELGQCCTMVTWTSRVQLSRWVTTALHSGRMVWADIYLARWEIPFIVYPALLNGNRLAIRMSHFSSLISQRSNILDSIWVLEMFLF